MLSDDITGLMRGVVNFIGRLAVGALKGAVLFGVAAFAIGALWSLGGAILLAAGGASAGAGAIGGGDLFTHAAMITGGTITHASAISSFLAPVGKAIIDAAVFGWSFVPFGAAAGAATLGVTSVIPGIKQGLGLGTVASAAKVPFELAGEGISKSMEPGRDIIPAPKQQPMENYAYKEGAGSAAMAKGNAAEPVMAKC